MSRLGLSYDEYRYAWDGMIALAGVAAETGVVRLVYLNEAYERRVRAGRTATVHDLREVPMKGTVQRMRPKMMTVTAIMGRLLRSMWTTGTDADMMMKRITAPLIGGMVSPTILTLIVIPILYSM